MTFSVLLSIFMIDLIVFYIFFNRNPISELEGFYKKDETVGFSLSPNRSFIWNDGVVNVRYTINEEGFRDDKIYTLPQQDILLIGDSFTFGSLLDYNETIDKIIEYKLHNTLQVYNLGVPGAGPPQILEFFKRCAWFKGTDVFYLFFNNDLRDDNLDPFHYEVINGFLVSRKNLETGVAFTKSELEFKVQEKTSVTGFGFKTLKNSFTLKHIRAKLDLINRNKRTLFCGNISTEFRKNNIKIAVNYVNDMKSYADDLGLKFTVVIIPSVEEAKSNNYSKPTYEFMSKISNSMNVLEIIDDVSIDDYFKHDGHFNSAGASKVASKILSCLSNSSIN